MLLRILTKTKYFLLCVSLAAPVSSQPRISIDSTAVQQRSAFDTLSVRSLSIARNDSLVRSDTGLVRDSSRLIIIPGIGKLLPEADTTSPYHQKEFIWSDARYAGEFLWSHPGFFLRDLGEVGQQTQIISFGWRGVDYRIDGIPFKDPITGECNLYDIPLEYVDEIEVVSGAMAPRYETSAQGAVINVVSRQYSRVKPLTKLRFVQGPDEQTLTDGFFTQNITRRINLSFGFQSLYTDGRYPNSKAEDWNAHTKLRYNVWETFNVALSHVHTKTINRVNAGVDPFRSYNMYDPIQAYINSNTTQETLTRNDFSLIGIGTFLGDSLSVTRFSLYSTFYTREFEDNDPSAITSLGVIEDHDATVTGAIVEQRILLNPITLNAGMTIEDTKINKSPKITPRKRRLISAQGSVDASVFDGTIASAFLRSDWLGSDNASTFGGSFKFAPLEWLNIFANGSNAYRFPTMQEAFWTDSMFVRSADIKKERHLFVEAGVEIVTSPLDVRFSFFDRSINDAIVLKPLSRGGLYPAIDVKNIDNVHIRGAIATLKAELYHVTLRGNATYCTYAEDDTTRTPFPDLVLYGELSYRNRLFDNALGLNIGVRAKYFSRSNRSTYIPQTMVFPENETTIIGRSGTFDVFAVFGIGDAHISIVWENVPNINYILTATYPMPGNNFRAGVIWNFFD
jgi:outer membrane cobalamin receptor